VGRDGGCLGGTASRVCRLAGCAAGGHPREALQAVVELDLDELIRPRLARPGAVGASRRYRLHTTLITTNHTFAEWREVSTPLTVAGSLLMGRIRFLIGPVWAIKRTTRGPRERGNR